MKRVISIIIVFVLIVGFGTQKEVNASTSIEKEKGKIISEVTYNEYDLCSELNKNSDKELLNEGYTEEQIFAIRDYKRLFRERANEKVKRITDLNSAANDKQVLSEKTSNIVENYTGTDKQVRALSASLNLVIFLDYAVSSYSYSEAKLRVRWYWDQDPLFHFDDILAVTWSENMYIDESESTAEVDYYSSVYETFEYTEEFDIEPKIGNAFFEFPLYWSYYEYTYAKKGCMEIVLTKNTNLNEAALQASYGHQTIVGTPKVSFTGMDIDFNRVIQEADSDYEHFDFD